MRVCVRARVRVCALRGAGGWRAPWESQLRSEQESVLPVAPLAQIRTGPELI